MMIKMKNAVDEIQCPQHVKLLHASNMLNPTEMIFQYGLCKLLLPRSGLKPTQDSLPYGILLTQAESNPK